MADVALRLRGWDVLSPFGGKAAFLDAMAAGRPLQKSAAATIRYVPDFDTRAQLGKKGTRNFDRHTGLFVKCASNAIEEASVRADALARTAIVNGTAAGSLSSIQDFLLDTYRQEFPYFVNPAHMPNTVINCAAGQCAIWHGMRGPNATLSAGAQSFQSAARLAARWGRSDYARSMLLGAVEEITPITADLHRIYAGQFATSGPLAEGAAAFLVEALDHGNISEDDTAIVATLTRTATTGDRTAAFAALVSDTIARAGMPPDRITLAVLKSWIGTSSYAAESTVAGQMGIRQLNAAQLFGNGYSVSGALQLALLLAELRPGECGITLSLSHNGSMACQIVSKGRRVS